jgi:hypothetical protein
MNGSQALNSSPCSAGLGVPLKMNISGPFGAPSIAYVIACLAVPWYHLCLCCVTFCRSYQNYDYLIGIGGGIGFTPFMSILKDFLNKKHEEWDAEDGRTQPGGVFGSRQNVALFYGICRSFDDVAWWSSLTCEPNFSALVQSCSVLINAGKRRVRCI